MRILRLAVLTLAAAGLTGPANAGCRIALALAVDVSRSISTEDYAIQRDGLIDALADPAVQAAFLQPDDHVALAVYEWSGIDHQTVIADWRDIRSAADLAAVSDLIAAHQRLPKRLPTALGQALSFGHDLIGAAPPGCAAFVLDVSGDGRNNDGVAPSRVYERLDFSAVTVNGLAIGEHESGLIAYFRSQLIRGPGAFVEIAPTQADFPEAIRRKLIRELTQQISLVPAVPQGDPRG